MKGRREVPSGAEFGETMAFLAGQRGVTPQVAREVIGNGPNGRTRQEITNELREWLRTRSKA